MESPQSNENIEKLGENLFKGAYATCYFDEEGKFQPAPLSQTIRVIYPMKTMEANLDIFIYNKKMGFYEPNGNNKLRVIIKKSLSDMYREKHAIAIIDDITATTTVSRSTLEQPIHLIPVKNCVLDIGSNPPKALPHNPEYFFTSVLPTEFNPNARCPSFLKFLEQILPEKRYRLQIQEMFGNTLWREYTFDAAFMLIGAGNNGNARACVHASRLL